MAMSSPVPSERVHVENNVILTTKDEISCQQTFNYLCMNLDSFRIGSEFVVVCGVHGSPDGEMLEGDEDFYYDYEAMFRWFHDEKRYKRCAPRNSQPFELVEKRQYQMGTVIEMNSVRDPVNEGRYKLDERSKVVLKTQFERLVSTKKPVVLFLASCWSHSSEISDILRSCGIYSTLRLLEDKGEVTMGRFFKLDSNQTDILSTVAFDHNQNDPYHLKSKNVFLYGSHGTGKTILLSEIFMMRLAYYNLQGINLCKKIFVSFSAYSEDFELLQDIKERYIGISNTSVQYTYLKSLCHEYNVSMDNVSPLKIINDLIQKISIATKGSRSIFFLDEVFGKNQLGETNFKCDWSNLRIPNNLDVLIAINPQGIDFKQRFQVIVPTNENILARRLVGKHRNSPSISALLDHYKALFEQNSYLESSIDMELEMPSGDLPIWIQKEKSESHYEVLTFIKDNFIASYNVTLLYHESSASLAGLEYISQWCREHKWKFIDADKVVGSEYQFIITYNFPPGPEHISRARNGLVMVTTKGQNYKIFDNLINTAVVHKKKNYTCNIIPSCSFNGSEFVIKSSLRKKHRFGTHSKDEILKKLKLVKTSILVLLAIIMVFTLVALGVAFGVIFVLETNSVLKPVKVPRYLIVGGSQNTTEVFEYITSNSTPSYGQLPTRRQFAVGIMFGNAPIVCGGTEIKEGEVVEFDSCLTFEKNQWNQTHFMTEKRVLHAGVLINNTAIWILGGSEMDMDYHEIRKDSTEFIIKGQANGIPGPKLPYGLHRMCAVKLYETEIFVIGGNDEINTNRNEVWIYNPQNGFARTQGPSLSTARYYHSCSTMRDGEKTLIVVAGGYESSGRTTSVEIYDPELNAWNLGPNLPDGFQGTHPMAESHKGVLLFGGAYDGDPRGTNYILELQAGGNWTILNNTLQEPRAHHTVIPIN